MRRIGTERRHIHSRERLIDAPADLSGRHAEILRAERHIILDDRRDELIVRILEHHADLLPDAPDLRLLPRIDAVDAAHPLRRQQQRIEMLRERRLPRPIRAEHRDELPALDGERHIIQRPPLSLLSRMIHMREMFYFDKGHSHRSFAD